MNIAVIYCSGGLNIGNEFINAGGHYLVKEAFPDANIHKFEYFDTSVKAGWKYLSEPLTKSSKSFIENKCDLGFLFAGSMLSEVCLPALEYFRDLKIPIVIMGISGHKYTIQEQEIAKQLPNWFDKIFTRDKKTFDYINAIKTNDNVYYGLDLGFYANELMKPRNENTPYAVLNFDPASIYIPQITARRQQILDSMGYEDVYVSENSHFTPRNIPGYIQISYWHELYNLYANADYIETTRIHTALVALTNGVKFTYVGGKTGRSNLFEKFEIELKSGITINTNYSDLIYKEKLKFKKEFIDIVKEYIYE